MRVGNPLDFTENHRFYVYRDFALSPVDMKMIQSIYQPMIGANAINYYMALSQQLAADRIGFSAMEQQRKLFLMLNLPVGEAGRTAIVDAASRLEAVGLLQSARKYMADRDEWVIFYHLLQPLNAYDFFNNPHLTMLLRDKLGKAPLIRMRQELSVEEPLECRDLLTEDVSTPFYELFQLNTSNVDVELDQALAEMAPIVRDGVPNLGDEPIQVEDLLLRLPRNSANRARVEALKGNRDQVVFINFVAKKFGLSTVDICRLLDEEEMFWADGSLDEDRFSQQASLLYSQSAKQTEQRELRTANRDDQGVSEGEVAPAYQELPPKPLDQLMNIEQYNFLLRNEPYTQFIKRFFPGSVPEVIDKLFIRLDVNYKLANEVINVLIHYLKAQDLSWNRSFVETIAADLLGKHVNSFEKAILYIREQQKYKERRKNEGENPRPTNRTNNAKATGSNKPRIPVAEVSDGPSVTDEEYLSILKKHQLTEDGDE
jgi:replication initiation and membrane attachment protein